MRDSQSATIYQGIEVGEAEVFTLAVEHEARLIQLQANGIRLSESPINKALQEAGEID